jgi:hypothetical protein
MRLAGLVLCCWLSAAPALAQAAYVVGSVGVELSRVSRLDSGDFAYPAADGEVLGGAVRVGTSIGESWGAEVEFAHAATIEDEAVQNSRIFSPQSPVTFVPLPGGGSAQTNLSVVPIPIAYSFSVETRNPTLSTVVWIRQPVTGSVDLVYLGGIAFTRRVQEQEVSFSPPLLPIIVPAGRTARSTFYHTAPVVGMEARIGLTEHVRLVPGVRLQGLGGDPGGGGWLLRAAVGLGWFF